ncbi:MFS transporter [Flavobacterium nackdongense]|uniref:MFS transporter n=1 Tax=Flavobacterium nackdongense TaxID=2547394 RepID=A0A4P6YAL7_9FLAO|nr:MFS transporter [Flavobacterium nackdongense]QBN17290.1 MFS transporter [Flavobacterium nackdongense]
MNTPQNKNPWYWIPTLNFASGLPYAIIVTVSVIMYKNLGVNNEDIGLYTSFLYLPWVIKPLWSPFIDLYSTKRNWFLAMQLVIAIAFIFVGFTIPANNFFFLTLAFFWMAAFASASNDVATDGFYMLALTKEKQALFLGIRSTFYRLAMLTGNGLIVILGGYLEIKYGDKTKAWSHTMVLIGTLMALITIYNFFTTPKAETTDEYLAAEKTEKPSFGKVFSTFFQKKQIGLILAFILIFRLGEAQLLKMLNPFLMDPLEKGGLGLSTESIGLIYGTFGIIALVIGGILGGIAISKNGLKKWMLPMVLAMRIPILGFVLLAHFQPQSHLFIYLTVILEQFGYGFGFAAFMMYLIYVAEGEFKTSHYSLATGFMALGMMLPGMISGYIQEYLGYENFFIWIVISTIPGLILSQYLTYPTEFGKKEIKEN